MYKKTYISILFYFVSNFLFGQYYNASQIATINNSKAAFEGNMYLDTINSDFYIGLTNGRLAKIGDELDELIDSINYSNGILLIYQRDTLFSLSIPNIYNSDGNLVGARTLNLNNYDLFFVGSNQDTITFQNDSGYVGLRTNNPTVEMDVNGQIRVRELPLLTNSAGNLGADSDGHIGLTNTYSLIEATGSIATSNVDQTISGTSIINNINIGLSISVTIPANKEATVIIFYSVPIGVSSFSSPEGYYGIRFLRNGVEAVQGSRKSSIQNTGQANMITISHNYIEIFPSSPTATTVTFTLNGYVEQYSGSSHTYRYNMWSVSGTNYNWGRATITKTVYVK